MIKLLDFILCSTTVLAELIAIILALIIVQAILYRGFGFNPYMWVINKLKKLERRIQEWTYLY